MKHLYQILAVSSNGEWYIYSRVFEYISKQFVDCEFVIWRTCELWIIFDKTNRWSDSESAFFSILASLAPLLVTALYL